MKAIVKGSPAFAHIQLELGPGETVFAESDAMVAMSAELDMTARANGGFFSALAKKFLGGESFFINEFVNNTKEARQLTLTQKTPGDIRQITINGNSICLQPGAYIASTPGLTLGVEWAGIASLIAREGLFKLRVGGIGTLWYGAYGGLVERMIDGEYIVDTSHLVSYEPHMKLKTQLAGGLIASFLGGEGLVTRVEGKGKIVLQSRSMSGLAGWLNPKI